MSEGVGHRDVAELVTRAVAANLGVQEAEARLREARARRVIARSGFFPTLEASGGTTRNDSADGLRNNAANVGGSSGANWWQNRLATCAPGGARLSSTVDGISISTIGFFDQPKAFASIKA